MGKRVHPVTSVLAILVVLVIVAMVFARRSDQPKAIGTSGGGAGMEEQMAARRGSRAGGRGGNRGSRGGGRSGQGQQGGGQMVGSEGSMSDTSLGINFRRSVSPQGFQIEKFEGSPNPSPLKLMGLQEGDVITSCNGQRQQMRNALVQAIQDLSASGKPIALTIDRGGKAMDITWKEKLPAAAVVTGAVKPKASAEAKPAAPKAETKKEEPKKTGR